MEALLTILVIGFALWFFFKKIKQPVSVPTTNLQAGTSTGQSIDLTALMEQDPIFMNHVRIIKESIEIINKTKNIETGLSRFEVVKDNIVRIFERLPEGQSINFNLGSIEMNTIQDIYQLDKLKAEW